MKVSYDELVQMAACEPGLERFVTQTQGTLEPVDVLSLIGGVNTTLDLLWLAGRRLPKARIVEFAIKCARAVEMLNDDPRVKAAIDAAENWVRGPTEDNRKAAAWAAADAAAAWAAAAADAADAADAAWAARAAAWAAARAAADAAWAAADAADAAGAAAWAAADAADAAGADMPVNDYLRELFG